MTSAPADVVILDGTRIAAVGDAALLSRYPDADIIELGGRILCPGFIDAHNHLSIAALIPRWADVRGVANVDELGEVLTAHARTNPETPWIRASGWTDLGTGFAPHRRDLDALDLGRPVVVAHYSLHQCVVNSRGLAALGIGTATPDPPGGEIGRDASGEPSGLLVERAWSDAHARSLEPYSDPDRWAEHIEVRARELLADGVTCVHDAACAPAAEIAYRRLADARRLPISVLAMPHPAALLQPLEVGRLEGPPTGEGDEWLRVGAVKLFADGGVTPAIDVHLGGRRLEFGTVFEGLTEQVGAVVERGFDVAVHAIGNAGLAAALAAYAACPSVPGREARLRVEHACLAGVQQLRDMAALGVHAVVQPGFVHHLGGQVEGATFDDAAWLPFGDLARAGVALAASSDDPCTFHEPLRSAAHGATRRTSTGGILDIGQALGYEEWLRAYTAGAADAGNQLDERGRLARGLRADLVVLDGELDPERPPVVAQTWVAGRLEYACDPSYLPGRKVR
jgi:Predicted metal-dependent hydrolase with the TIM-barrel fold